MYGRGFEEVHANFVEVGYRADEVGCYMALAVEFLETTPDMHVLPFGRLSFRVLGVCVAVYPLFHVDEAGSVVDFEGCICGLGGDVVDLADEGDLDASEMMGESTQVGDILGLLRCRRS